MDMNGERVDVLDLRGKQRVRRWRTGAGGTHGEEFVSIGWTPDGRWWVEDTRHRRGWRFEGDTPESTRQLAQSCADALMREGDWKPAIATYEPGVAPARAAEVPEWPPGREPV